ncbi:MAG: hypothetical protein CMJ59_02955 [Planctomycetaceae bacterium]|nr:hypothetical protein [Planctomycetaceae bacterium]
MISIAPEEDLISKRRCALRRTGRVARHLPDPLALHGLTGEDPNGRFPRSLPLSRWRPFGLVGCQRSIAVYGSFGENGGWDSTCLLSRQRVGKDNRQRG